MKVRVHVLVKGIVQGVFFRAFVRDKAHDLKVNGYVKNTGVDKLEAVFEGEKFNVTELIDFCRTGPPHARVDKIDVKKEDFKGEFDSFSVRY